MRCSYVNAEFILYLSPFTLLVISVAGSSFAFCFGDHPIDVGKPLCLSQLAPVSGNKAKLLIASALEATTSKTAMLEALPQTQVRLYFPSEYGVDHTLHDFPNDTWDLKKRHMDLGRRVARGKVKVCRIFIGSLLGGHYSRARFPLRKKRVGSVGSMDTKISYTSMDNVGKILASIATLSSGELANVPETIRLSGTEASMAGTAQMTLEATGKKVSVSSVDGPAFKRTNLDSEDQNLYPYLRFLMGDGSIDNRRNPAGGLGNDNELLFLGGTRPRCRTMWDLLKERHGST